MPVLFKKIYNFTYSSTYLYICSKPTTVGLCPVRVQHIKDLVQLVFGDRYEHVIYGDLHPIGVIEQPAYCILSACRKIADLNLISLRVKRNLSLLFERHSLKSTPSILIFIQKSYYTMCPNKKGNPFYL